MIVIMALISSPTVLHNYNITLTVKVVIMLKMFNVSVLRSVCRFRIADGRLFVRQKQMYTEERRGSSCRSHKLLPLL